MHANCDIQKDDVILFVPEVLILNYDSVKRNNLCYDFIENDLVKVYGE